MKKRIFNYSLSIIATAIMLLSCKENLGLTDIENTDPNSLTINEAKLWFEKNITNKSSARIGGQDEKKAKMGQIL